MIFQFYFYRPRPESYLLPLTSYHRRKVSRCTHWFELFFKFWNEIQLSKLHPTHTQTVRKITQIIFFCINNEDNAKQSQMNSSWNVQIRRTIAPRRIFNSCGAIVGSSVRPRCRRALATFTSASSLWSRASRWADERPHHLEMNQV